MQAWAPPEGFWERRGLPDPQPEHRFHPVRKWRFDFCWLGRKIAIEVDGGTWANMRHSRGSGILGDMEKINEAQRLGWKVFRFTPQQMSLSETAEFLRNVFNGA